MVSRVRHDQTRSLVNGTGSFASLSIQYAGFLFSAVIFDLLVVGVERQDKIFKHSHGSHGCDDHSIRGAEKYVILRVAGSYGDLKTVCFHLWDIVNIRKNNAFRSSLEKLSSCLRINRAADDAAGLSISEKMRCGHPGRLIEAPFPCRCIGDI